MASLPFPDTGTRLVLLQSGNTFKTAPNARGYLYSDEELTVPAEVYRDVNGVKGALIPEDEDGRVSIRLNARGEQVDYWGPADGTDRLWILVNGVASKVDADYNARLDSVGARVTDLESGSAADNTVLHKTGAETKSGVLTFTSSPVVPTPDDSVEAANKGYVDNTVSAETTARQDADALLVPQTRTISVTGPITGGGTLAANRTIGVSNATAGAVGVVQLAGDLAGTATAPTIATGAITSAKIADGTIVDGDISGTAAIAQSKVSGLTTALSTEASARADGDTAVATAAATDATTKANAAQAAAVQRSNHTGTQTTSTITGLDTALAAKADLVGGTIPTAQIPAIALTTFLGAVASQAAMLALTGQPGDWATRTDTGTTWQITGSNPALIGSWTQLLTPADAVSSVNGQVGPVVLAKGDVGLGNVDNTSDASKPVSTAQQAALDLRAFAGYLPVNGNVASGVDPTGAIECSAALQTILDAYAQVGDTGAQRVVRLQGIFNISSTIVIKGSVDASAAIFNYSGSGTAIRIGNSASGNLSRLTVNVGQIVCTSKPGTGWVAGSSGLVVTNVFRSTITFQHIKHFETGLAALGDDRYGFFGTSYCRFEMGTLNNNKVNLLIDRASGSGLLGYSTQNTYIAGSYAHAEGTYPAAGQRHIQIGVSGTALALDNNLFLNPSIEGSTEEYLIDCNGSNNLWLAPRMEFVGNPAPIRWGAQAYRNLIIGGVGINDAAQTYVTGAISNNIIGTHSMLFSTATDPGVVLQTPTGGSTAALTVMGAGSLVETGGNPTTAYTIRVQPSQIKMKTAADTTDRLFVDGLNRKIVLGSGPTSGTVGLYWGSGSPEGVITANPTSVYWDYSGSATSTWTKLSGTGNTGWAPSTAPRVTTTASSATPTPNAASTDIYDVSALAAGATFGAPTGSPVDGQSLMIRVKDNGTARTLAWNAIYRAIGTVLPTATVASKQLYVGCRYNSAATKWDVLAVGAES